MALLEVTNLTKAFDGNAILKGISFQVEEGQVILSGGLVDQERRLYCVV